MELSEQYYVYVYIDPRNYEEFYYGKGKGTRKTAHLFDDDDSEKTRRIQAIKQDGLLPIIKVIAKNLSEHDALLIEKTLIWKLGRSLTNTSQGHFKDNFRPHNTFHRELHGFDFQNGLYLVNVGDGPHRCWEDCRAYGFLSAGQDPKYSNPIRTLEVGDLVIAYLKDAGYVGVGRVSEKALPVVDFRFDGKVLSDLPLKQKGIFDNYDNKKTEYLTRIDWIKTFARSEAKWVPKKKLFTTQLVKASLQAQTATVKYLEGEFGIQFSDILLS